MDSPIDRFEGEFRFLSNFHPASVSLDGFPYPTVEHAFQASKTLAAGERHLIRTAPTPGKAKQLGRTIALRPDWDVLRLSVMEDLVRRKFSDAALAGQLLATGDRELIEGNHWGDVFWGVCRGRGENHLGRILMKIREELKRPRGVNRSTPLS